MKAIILAAGKGKRLNSEADMLPKALREVCGKPILEYVLDAVNFVEKTDVYIVVGFMRKKVIECFPEYNFIVQEEQLGTGHAVKCASEEFSGYSGDVMVMLGDTPTINKNSLQNLVKKHKDENNLCTILSCKIDDKLGIGRIVRENGIFTGIVENQDCNEEQKNITEYNTGVMIFNSPKLFFVLDELKNNNKQGEYYITDVPKLFMSKGYKTGVYTSLNKNDILGVNSKEDLAEAEAILSYNNHT